MRQVRFPGEAFRVQREALGVSLQDAHDHTHVPTAYLRAIEEGRIEALPIKTYAMGFIRSYCEFLDLEPEPFVDQFYACIQDSAGANHFFRSRSISTWRRPRWTSSVLAWTAVCALLIFGWFTYNAVVRPLVQNMPERVDAGTLPAPPGTIEDGL